MLGVEFVVCPADVNEDALPGESPLDTQRRITHDKARVARCGDGIHLDRDSVVIACDTTVLLDGEMLNKPSCADEARTMLRRLRGRAHQVQSVIVIRRGELECIDTASSQVVMRNYSDEEIEAYVATGDPFDKAGSYAVQHAAFRPVAEIRGCPLNVVGLALCHLCAYLPQLPDSAPVCETFFSRSCPQTLDDPIHVVTFRQPISEKVRNHP